MAHSPSRNTKVIYSSIYWGAGGMFTKFVVCGKRTKQTLTTATVLSIIQYDLSRCCMPFDNDTDNDMVDQHIHLAQALSLSLGRIPGSHYESGYRG